ncbi:glucokinase [Solilutibacter silvestris]|uniref:Glucokinase n=1 Tax=Solilutibacter silvestris TaxID=1645665 RepID=A0A2K1Q194_9GAMM|nr:glucokinase [Lysobacter silvestris]PNS08815.1 Glucokinase [Lysobacter silvestris]
MQGNLGSIAERFVAADIGGTHARVALVQVAGDGAIDVQAYRKYNCAEFPSLTAILADFIAGQQGGTERMAIASAGVVLDGEVINSNLPWRVSLAEMRRELGLRELHVINDFAAAAHGAGRLATGDLRLLTPGVDTSRSGPMLVIGAGTGLGAAICISTVHGNVVLPTEAGMTAFAPVTPREIEILRWLQRDSRHVAVEQLVSGPGLANLYRAICAIDGVATQFTTPADISNGARAGDAQARDAVLSFCALLGSVIGDLAVISCAGSVHVAGGVLPQLLEFLPHSDFRARLVDKGAMRVFNERVPVWLIENERLGVLGAASWYQQHLRECADDSRADNNTARQEWAGTA